MTTTTSLRVDLEGKRDRGVKQVRVTTMIGALQEIEQAGGSSIREGVDRLRELEALKADLAEARADIEKLEARIAKPRVTRLSGDLLEALERGRGSNPVIYDGIEVSGILLGTAEAAAVLGVERPRVAKWRELGRIPPPLADLAAGPVWLREQIEPLREEALAGRRGERRLESEPSV